MIRLYDNIVRAAMFRLPAETAHEIGIEALRMGLGTAAAQRAASKRFLVSPFGELTRFGLTFKNPLGMAAGFDKNGKVVNQLAALGFGFVEVGTVTFEPQSGNEKPRLFRLPEDKALINRLGFNNEGAKKVVARLRALDRECILGINIGKNKNAPIEEAAQNYLRSFELAHPVADYIAVNVSSPNTPSLRDLQKAENLEELLETLQARNRQLGAKPLLVKIAPDLSEADVESIVDLCLGVEIAGIIATNTTVSRDRLKTPDAGRFGGGGLSGHPLHTKSNEVISAVHRLSAGRIPIIGVGGVFSGADALDKVKTGACLLQAYTGFVYGGPAFARDLNLELHDELCRAGFSTLDEAVGTGI